MAQSSFNAGDHHINQAVDSATVTATERKTKNHFGLLNLLRKGRGGQQEAQSTTEGEESSKNGEDILDLDLEPGRGWAAVIIALKCWTVRFSSNLQSPMFSILASFNCSLSHSHFAIVQFCRKNLLFGFQLVACRELPGQSHSLPIV